MKIAIFDTITTMKDQKWYVNNTKEMLDEPHNMQSV